MKKCQLTVVLVLLITSVYAQIKFEKGYYIDNDDTKVECLIKNMDWANNPTDIEYKTDENSESKHLTATAIKEFGVYQASKYIARTVSIDRSTSQVSSLTTNPNPVFKEETLFLKVLVEGKGNLYGYDAGDLRRFFYNVDNGNIEQLIFKVYLASQNVGATSKISENNRFRQQLWNSLQCSSVDKKKFENLHYEKKALTKVFTEYNSCTGSKVETFEDKVERNVFAINIRPRLNFSSFSVDNPADASSNYTWDDQMSFGLGVEGEFILPVNKEKWSVVLEPNYMTFSGSTSSADLSSPGATRIAKVDYTSIDLPLSVRYYFFLNEKSRIFLNAGINFNFAVKSSKVEITRGTGYPLAELDLNGGQNVLFGAGFKYRAFTIEGRYQSTRNPLNKYRGWGGEYKTISAIVGYTLFTKRS